MDGLSLWGSFDRHLFLWAWNYYLLKTVAVKSRQITYDVKQSFAGPQCALFSLGKNLVRSSLFDPPPIVVEVLYTEIKFKL